MLHDFRATTTVSPAADSKAAAAAQADRIPGETIAHNRSTAPAPAKATPAVVTAGKNLRIGGRG